MQLGMPMLITTQKVVESYLIRRWNLVVAIAFKVKSPYHSVQDKRDVICTRGA